MTTQQLPSNGGSFRLLGWNTAYGNGMFNISNSLYNLKSPGGGSDFGTTNVNLSGGGQSHPNVQRSKSAYVYKRTV